MDISVFFFWILRELLLFKYSLWLMPVSCAIYYSFPYLIVIICDSFTLAMCVRHDDSYAHLYCMIINVNVLNSTTFSIWFWFMARLRINTFWMLPLAEHQVQHFEFNTMFSHQWCQFATTKSTSAIQCLVTFPAISMTENGDNYFQNQIHTSYHTQSTYRTPMNYRFTTSIHHSVCICPQRFHRTQCERTFQLNSSRGFSNPVCTLCMI